MLCGQATCSTCSGPRHVSGWRASISGLRCRFCCTAFCVRPPWPCRGGRPRAGRSPRGRRAGARTNPNDQYCNTDTTTTTTNIIIIIIILLLLLLSVRNEPASERGTCNRQLLDRLASPLILSPPTQARAAPCGRHLHGPRRALLPWLFQLHIGAGAVRARPLRAVPVRALRAAAHARALLVPYVSGGAFFPAHGGYYFSDLSGGDCAHVAVCFVSGAGISLCISISNIIYYYYSDFC
jgi:hypothetical protein